MFSILKKMPVVHRSNKASNDFTWTPPLKLQTKIRKTVNAGSITHADLRHYLVNQVETQIEELLTTAAANADDVTLFLNTAVDGSACASKTKLRCPGLYCSKQPKKEANWKCGHPLHSHSGVRLTARNLAKVKAVDKKIHK